MKGKLMVNQKACGWALIVAAILLLSVPKNLEWLAIVIPVSIVLVYGLGCHRASGTRLFHGPEKR